MWAAVSGSLYKDRSAICAYVFFGCWPEGQNNISVHNSDVLEELPPVGCSLTLEISCLYYKPN